MKASQNKKALKFIDSLEANVAKLKAVLVGSIEVDLGAKPAKKRKKRKAKSKK